MVQLHPGQIAVPVIPPQIPTIGSEADARYALKIAQTQPSYTGPREDGWSPNGAGAFRRTWVAPDGTLYKVCHRDWEDTNQSRGEARRWRMLLRHPEWADLVPAHTLYEIDGRAVTAVEFIPYLDYHLSEAGALALRRQERRVLAAGGHVGAGDLYGDNMRFRTVDGGAVMVDLGNGYHDNRPVGCAECVPGYIPEEDT